MPKKKYIKLLKVWILFIVLFCTLSVIVLTRASGYKFNKDKLIFEKTGLIKVRTIPSKADVYLDNELVLKKTPLRMSFISPGKYQIEIKKKNYILISKDIIVKSGMVTALDKTMIYLEKPIILPVTHQDAEMFIDFKEDTQSLINAGELYYTNDDELKLITRFSENILASRMMPNKNYVIFQLGNSINSINIDGSELTKIYSLENSNKAQIITENSGKYLLIKQDDKVVKLQIY